jgi:hypothetical protein
VRCGDATCARSVSECPPFSNCNAGDFFCGDGTCAVSEADCNPLPFCPPASPYMCFDSTCRASPEDCPPPPTCPASRRFLCPNGGSCVIERTQCVSSVDAVCDDNAPVRCANGECKRKASECVNIMDSACPFGRSVCPDGSCRISEEDCAPAVCPFYYPFKCATGQCVTSAEECTKPLPCPDNAQYTQCYDGTCVDDVKKCTITYSNGNCDPFTYRCDDGLCVKSLSQCPANLVSNSVCSTPGATFQCADGKCVKDSYHCSTVKLCGSGTLEADKIRCLDGTCAPSDSLCSVKTDICRTGYSMCRSGVDSGRCLPTGTCRSISSGCPAGLTRCENGECLASPSDCSSLQTSPCAGSPSSVKCWDGSCSAVAASCPASNGCDHTTPFRCSLNSKLPGTCVKDSSECGTTPVGACAVKCLDGSCATSAENCLLPNRCSLSSPIRCMDGTCAAFGKCNAVVACPPDAPFKCADGSCQGAKNLCKYLIPCPASKPYRCTDLSCVVTSSECLNRCPPASPVKCPDGNCVSFVGDCINPMNIVDGSNGGCQDSKVRCFDGTCKANTQSCSIDPASSIDPCKSALKVMCPSGYCRSTLQECVANGEGLIRACPSDRPKRCSDGSCLKTSQTCGAPISCSRTVDTRCADGVCREVCPDYNGCNVNEIACQDFRCLPFTVSTEQTVTCAEDTTHTCPTKELPFRCPDNSCVVDAALCPPSARGETFMPQEAYISCFKESVVEAMGNNGKFIGRLSIPPNAVETAAGAPCDSGKISLVPVPDSVAIRFTTPVDVSRYNDGSVTDKPGADVYTLSLSFFQTALSAVVEVGSAAKFTVPIRLELATDMIQKSFEMVQADALEIAKGKRALLQSDDSLWMIDDDEKCLAVANLEACLKDVYECTWKCVSSGPIDYVGDGIYGGLISSSGMYAVIYKPKVHPKQPEPLTLWQQYWWQLLVAIGCGVLLCVIVGYVLMRFARYRRKWREVKKNLAEKGPGHDEIVVYQGADINIFGTMPTKEEVELQQNPLVTAAVGAGRRSPLEAVDLTEDQKRELAEKKNRVAQLMQENNKAKKDNQIGELKESELTEVTLRKAAKSVTEFPSRVAATPHRNLNR